MFIVLLIAVVVPLGLYLALAFASVFASWKAFFAVAALAAVGLAYALT